MVKKEEWTHIIRSRKLWFDIRFTELWQYRDLIFIFIKRDFVSVYKQTLLGPLWHLIQPLLSSFIFAFAFSFIGRISTSGIPPVIFYLSGIIPWTYFADCTNRTSGTFAANAGIFGKVHFPRLVAPVSVVLSCIVKFLIQFSLFIFFLSYYLVEGNPSIQPNLYLLFSPFLVLIMAILGLGIGLIVTSMTIRYKDLANLVGFGVQLLMYLSTVIFPVSMWEDISRNHPQVIWIIYANPMTPIIESFRYGFLGIGVFDSIHLLYSLVFSLIIFFIGVVVFNRVEKNFIDTI